MSTPRSLRLERGPRPLDALLQLPPGPGPHPPVVVCHGFKGFMEWGFHPALAQALVGRGLAVLRFNFSGAGVAPGQDRVTDFAAFRHNTFSKELEDLLAVVAALPELAPGRLDVAKLALLGHSRGGAIALLAAALLPPDRLRSLVTWAAVSHFDRGLSEDERERWRRDGVYTVLNQRTGQELPLGRELLEDLETNAVRLDLSAAARRRRCPWLLVHGTADETVPVAEGRILHGAAAPPCELVEVPGGSHTFGAVHPYQGPTPELDQALTATFEWLGPRP